MPYLSASVVVIHYEEALYQVYAPLPLPLLSVHVGKGIQQSAAKCPTTLQFILSEIKDKDMKPISQ